MELPLHGAVVHLWGMDSDVRIVFDEDARTLQVKREDFKGHFETTRVLSDKTLAEIRSATFAAWHEEPRGPLPRRRDSAEALVVLDGDEAFEVDGDLWADDTGRTGRPAAARALRMIDDLAEHGW